MVQLSQMNRFCYKSLRCLEVYPKSMENPTHHRNPPLSHFFLATSPINSCRHHHHHRRRHHHHHTSSCFTSYSVPLPLISSNSSFSHLYATLHPLLPESSSSSSSLYFPSPPPRRLLHHSLYSLSLFLFFLLFFLLYVFSHPLLYSSSLYPCAWAVCDLSQ